MSSEKRPFVPPEEVKSLSAEKRANPLKKVGTLLGIGVLSIAGMTVAAADQPVCEGQSDALNPILQKIAEEELEGKTGPGPITGTDEDLSPSLRQAAAEHFQESLRQGSGCTIEIGPKDK